MRPPRRDHYLPPATGDDTHAALDAATHQLAGARNLDPPDPASALHLLASLAAQLDARLGPAIGDARRYGCSWAEIADLLGVTRASAWQRWARHDTTAEAKPGATPAATPTPPTPPRPGGSNRRPQRRR
ncbi:MAG TPA: hypothetical protein VFQ42_18110 [Mycobacterium sp.]|nr:hypothetical protein [Mycobacterium sp.]